MCGRFVRSSRPEQLAKRLGARWHGGELPPSYNVAPSQDVLAVRPAGDGREAVRLRWGLVPAWAKEPQIGYKMINARAESVTEKPAYRGALRYRRCLVPADGFYEWRAEAGGKQPYYVRRIDGEPVVLAGLWDRWERAPVPIESCTIITTRANDDIAPLHHRMPVVLDPADWSAWLEEGQDPLLLRELLQPAAEGVLTWYRVSRRVNKTTEDGPTLTEPELDPADPGAAEDRFASAPPEPICKGRKQPTG
jgi:putative SOS response-associated peptidase YedK